MPGVLAYLICIAAGYILGSVSFAVLIAKSHGIDIFKVGSGNPGATNVLRTLGKKAGYTCFLLDAFKGIGAALIGLGLSRNAPEASPELLGIVGLASAIIGHSFSVFLRFKGGKGVATTVGGLLMLYPLVMLIGIVVWLVMFYSFRYVSLASIALGLSLPISALFLSTRTGLVLCFLLALVIVVRHRANIHRLIQGTENRAKPRSKSA